jgi:hypothetical protein
MPTLRAADILEAIMLAIPTAKPKALSILAACVLFFAGTAANATTVPVPSIDITTSPPFVVGEDITFDGSATLGSPPYSFLWDFSNGVSAITQDTIQSFAVAGPYTVTLEVQDSNGSVGTTLPYDFTVSNPSTPLPTALPLFATGLGAMGLIGWRRKRKAQAVA